MNNLKKNACWFPRSKSNSIHNQSQMTMHLKVQNKGEPRDSEIKRHADKHNGKEIGVYIGKNLHARQRDTTLLSLNF